MPITLIPQAGDSVAQAATVTLGLVTLASPAASTPVSISGLVQVQNPVPAAGEFVVDYQGGVLHFNAAQEGASITVNYQPSTAPVVTVAKANEVIEAVNALEGEDPESILTTKGDLIGRTAAIPARIAVGANGQVLTADSAVALGVKWATPAAGMTNPMDAAGDLIIGGVAGAPTKLPIGADTAVLTVAAGVPSWNIPPFVNIPVPFQYDESFVYDSALGNDVFIFVEGAGWNAIGIMGAAIGSDDLLTIEPVPVQSIGRVAHFASGALVTARLSGFNLSVRIPAAVVGLVNGNTYRVALLVLRVVPG